MKIAFVVGAFPVISETFVINQVADLMDRGIDVEVFSFGKGDRENISLRFREYGMSEIVHYLEMPQNYVRRFLSALPKLMRILREDRRLLRRIFNFRRHGLRVLSLRLLFWVEPFIGKQFDLVHCHFGTVANSFLVIREILGLRQKLVTTFYGYDASLVFREEPLDFYDGLRRQCSLFLVMSHDMKNRLVEHGFDRDRIRVLPVSIDVESYPYKERQLHDGEPVRIMSVGRFVEKKGFDDLLRALALIKKRTRRPFRCSIVGNGPLREDLRSLTESLGVQDVVEYKGYMSIEDVISSFMDTHVFVQPSKTALNGDME